MVTSVTPQAAANAYAASLNTAKLVSGGEAAAAPQGGSFADLIKDSLSEAIQTVKGGEQMSAKAVTGKADMIDVVQAVNAAELTLQSVVALRDRMISAYQEILRMPI